MDGQVLIKILNYQVFSCPVTLDGNYTEPNGRHNTTNYPPTGKWINKMFYTHKMKYFQITYKKNKRSPTKQSK